MEEIAEERLVGVDKFKPMMQPDQTHRKNQLLNQRHIRRWAGYPLGWTLLGAFVLMLTASGGASPTPGALTQLADPDGCVSETGSGGDCADGKGLKGARGIAVSRNGRHVYVASESGDAVAAFSRQK